ncbi:hypothetical protein OHA84_35980 [Streptomyces sp. NBC_00513]|uniref:hypothetical protein n=1 Tax=unclassified Streptomyces TaxID=2593676 RepID=UPI0022587E30|nr:hypothetical protein [Streptomyces sp. NBC_00424]MCX5071097.1 hypothetical protein [Streptomyces sp. NBC_00424]WUD45479.1 hypothetical protein OHA84_35980 [Streptomyces sp. NBC_00513]
MDVLTQGGQALPMGGGFGSDAGLDFGGEVCEGCLRQQGASLMGSCRVEADQVPRGQSVQCCAGFSFIDVEVSGEGRGI